MKVLLLGATGLLGHNVLQRLTDTGHDTVVLVRRRSGLHVEVPDSMVVEGSLTDRPTLERAAAGCDAIINCAGVTDMSLRHRRDYEAVNTQLGATLVEVMERLGISRLVHTSTVNTIGYGSAGHPADESEPMRAPFVGSFYAESKRAGEEAVLAAAARHAEWHVVVVNPGFMLGPMDAKPSSGRLLLTGYRRPLMAAPKGGKAFVDVRDVAAAAVNALTEGRNGARYVAVCNEGCLSLKEIYLLQAATMGYRQRVVELPDWLLRVAGAAGDVLRGVGVRTELSSSNVRQLMVREYYDSRRAIDELRMPQSGLAKAIRDFHRWREEEKTTRTTHTKK